MIERIIETPGLDLGIVNGRSTPVKHSHLTKDLDGTEVQENFSSSSVVGMLLYLARHSWWNIAYTVNWCTRYMFYPQHSHEEVSTHIGWYLKATRNRGLILDPKLAKDGCRFFRYVWA